MVSMWLIIYNSMVLFDKKKCYTVLVYSVFAQTLLNTKEREDMTEMHEGPLTAFQNNV